MLPVTADGVPGLGIGERSAAGTCDCCSCSCRTQLLVRFYATTFRTSAYTQSASLQAKGKSASDANSV